MAAVRGSHYGKHSTSAAIIERIWLQRYSGGTTPTTRTEKYNTRSITAVALAQSWGTGPAASGNPLVYLDAGDKPTLQQYWRAPRPWACIWLIDAEMVGIDSSGGVNSTNVYSLFWSEHNPGIDDRPVRGRRPTRTGLYHYHNHCNVIRGGLSTAPRANLRLNYCDELSRNARGRQSPNTLWQVGGAAVGGAAVGLQRTTGTTAGVKGAVGAAVGQQRTIGQTTAAPAGPTAAQAGLQRTSGVAAGTKTTSGATSGQARTSGRTTGIKLAAAPMAGLQRTANQVAAVKQATGTASGLQRTTGNVISQLFVGPNGPTRGLQRTIGRTVGVKGGVAAQAGQQRTSGVTTGVHRTSGAIAGQQQTSGQAATVKGARGAQVGLQRTAGVSVFTTVPPPRWVEGGSGATGQIEGASGGSQIEGASGGTGQTEGASSATAHVEGVLVGTGIVEGTGGV